MLCCTPYSVHGVHGVNLIHKLFPLSRPRLIYPANPYHRLFTLLFQSCLLSGAPKGLEFPLFSEFSLSAFSLNFCLGTFPAFFSVHGFNCLKI